MSKPGTSVAELEELVHPFVRPRPWVVFTAKHGVSGPYIHVQQVEHGTDALRDFLGPFQRHRVTARDVRVWRLVASATEDRINPAQGTSDTTFYMDGDVLMHVEQLLHDPSFHDTYRVIEGLADSDHRLREYLAELLR